MLEYLVNSVNALLGNTSQKEEVKGHRIDIMAGMVRLTISIGGCIEFFVVGVSFGLLLFLVRSLALRNCRKLILAGYL